jgi:hypothetical protein
MEPKLPAPNIGPERSSVDYGQALEQLPALPNFERPIESGHEQLEQRSESAPAAVLNPPVLPPPVSLPVPSPVTSTDDAVQVDDLPVVANDDDLIEKEWVDKAKKIILQTKDDPYRREQEVGKLQADYLRKRYGKELGTS